MTTAALSNGALAEERASRPSLEELVDRLMAALFGGEPETATTPTQSVARSVHEARRLWQAGDPDEALAQLAGLDLVNATDAQARWVYTEWLALARRRFGGQEALVYSPGTGRAAVLAPRADGSLEVAAVLGMPWRPGKVVSRRSLRGLKPLRGGPSWS